MLKPSGLSTNDFADAKQPVIVTACIEGITTDLLDRVPEQKHRKAIDPYCANGNLWVRVVAEKTGAKGFKCEVYDYVKYPGNIIPTEWRDYPTGLPQAVSSLLPEALHIEAMDDICEDLGKNKAGTTIKELLDEIMVPVLKAHANLNTAMETIRHILTADGDNRSAGQHTTRQNITGLARYLFIC